MSVVIKTVASKEDLKIFVKFPLQLYKDCPYFVPNIYADEIATLDPQQNAMGKYSLTRLFLAYKDGKVVGRIAAIINQIANRDWNHAEVRLQGPCGRRHCLWQGKWHDHHRRPPGFYGF